MISKVLLIILILLALASITTPDLKKSIIYLGILSLTSSFLFLLYGAPDVALAEAIIGSAISTALYLIALKKYTHFNIVCLFPEDKQKIRLLEHIEDYFNTDLRDVKFTHTNIDMDEVRKTKEYDLIIVKHSDLMKLYGRAHDDHLDELQDYLDQKAKEGYEIIRLQENDHYEN